MSKMKKMIMAITTTVLLLGACAGNDGTQQTEKLQVTDIQLPDTSDESLAQSSYKSSCAGCHGPDLQGGPAHPLPITGLSKEEVYITIIEGVGKMPGSMVTGENAENLAVWIAAQ